jgi:hypothetical protein
MIESVFTAIGGDRNDLEIPKRVTPLLEVLTWTSKKICILKGWEAFLRFALNHARMNKDLQIKSDTILSGCDNIGTPDKFHLVPKREL